LVVHVSLVVLGFLVRTFSGKQKAHRCRSAVGFGKSELLFLRFPATAPGYGPGDEKTLHRASARERSFRRNGDVAVHRVCREIGRLSADVNAHFERFSAALGAE
jgi:hypothetical protein